MSESPEYAAIGFDCPGGESNPNRPEAKLFLGDVTKKAILLPKPNHPPEARAANVSGVVRAEVVIDLNSGKVVWVKVTDGHVLLREAVKKVVCGAQFLHAFIDGPPARVSGLITYRLSSGRARNAAR